MAIPDENLWDYDAVTAGQAGTTTVVELTEENIAMYVEIAQNPDPRYQRSGSEQHSTRPLVAMPTMVLTYAPLLRENIAENCGFVALEESTMARRQTPFAKCEIRWHRLAEAGDTITGSRRVLEKYERRGSRFVTFGVSAVNQSEQLVAEYDYTCIFEYAKGQRQMPQDQTDSTSPVSDNAPEPMPGAQTPQPRLLTFGDIAVGDQLVSLTVTESEEIILKKNDFRLAGKHRASNIHTDEEFAKQNIFGEAVNSGPATMSYVDQMLQLSFPLEAFYGGGSLLMRAITPFRTTDIVTFEGEITEKRPHSPDSPLSQGGVVSCRVKGLNQRGDLVCLADATMVMPG
ncbi:MAG: hypothetical protein BZY75_06670 [SAR202 cluster bacterium Io17-Chloro-G7]|nr:MAG: hypothetical protein BZY75_06670 [SAR202 cluster bacterium Io17-Chloro-G7]